MTGDSVEARDVIAQRLLAQGLHSVNVAGGLLSDEAYAEVIARHTLAALSAAGFTVVRTDPQTMERAVDSMMDIPGPFSTPRERKRFELRQALVVLRGDQNAES